MAHLRAAGREHVRDISVTDLVTAAREGDAAAQAAFESVGDWLGIGLVNLVNLLNPQSIVLGGHLSAIYAMAPDRVASQLQTALPAARELVEVCSSQLGGDATLVGAAEVAFTTVLDDPVGALNSSVAS